MLAYAFHVLKEKNYEEVDTENFDNIHDLLAAILSKGLAQQLKQGLYREYITRNEDLSMLRGKINIMESVKLKIARKQRLSCEYDELSENNIFNQILKTTAKLLIAQPTVKAERKAELKKEMLFFANIDEIDAKSIKWSTLRFQHNNQNYVMLLNICHLVLDSLLYSDQQGQYKLMNFLDEQRMCRLYEKFILEYYRYHYKGILSADSSQVKWKDVEGETTFLPTMQTDIMLKQKHQGKTLIIDAKYYSKTMQNGQYNTTTFHSHNMYQIYTYVKNHDVNADGSVGGMLLYAGTDETIKPDNEFTMQGNKFYVKTLNLNKEFDEIKSQLDSIVENYFVLR